MAFSSRRRNICGKAPAAHRGRCAAAGARRAGEKHPSSSVSCAQARCGKREQRFPRAARERPAKCQCLRGGSPCGAQTARQPDFARLCAVPAGVPAGGGAPLRHVRTGRKAALPSFSFCWSTQSPDLPNSSLPSAEAQKYHTCGGQDARLRRASRAPCSFPLRVSHARGCRVFGAFARLLCSGQGKSFLRGCTEQVAHRVRFLSASRTPAAFIFSGPSPGSCVPGGAKAFCAASPG